jgi:hypothetical protein
VSESREELLRLAGQFCEQQLNAQDRDRLQTVLRCSDEDRMLFIEYVQLHGLLAWDVGMMSHHPLLPDELVLGDRQAENVRLPAVPAVPGRLKSGRFVAIAAMALLTMVIFGIVYLGDQHDSQQIAHSDQAESTTAELHNSPVVGNPDDSGNAALPGDLKPLTLDGVARVSPEGPAENQTPPAMAVESVEAKGRGRDDQAVVAMIDGYLQTSWQEYQVKPAAPADDFEWIRRAYLTLTGRIPSIEEVEAFQALPADQRRRQMTEKLLTDARTAEHLAVTWSNLLIGRSNSRGVDQDAMLAFLQDQFSQNRPWMETVGELIAAEGRSDENGATNFLLAHLNDQATPATAVTARLFLGRQVHCTQCHDHPFARDRRQEEFWALNAFFKTAVRSRENLPDASGKAKSVWVLRDSGDVGMTFFDTLRGLKKAVPPEFAGVTLPADQKIARRAELAKLLTMDDQHWVARSMVNRMWSHFFGYGFSNPVDDLGAHNPVSHPELFDELTAAFVDSNYDLQRLMRWMAMSQAFGLTSRQDDAGLVADNPEEGGSPLFSRSYSRPLGPEQVYESIRVAIRSAAQLPIDSSVGTSHRRQWVEQFVRSYGTDENDEQISFEGNLATALLMMNGSDVQEAIPLAAAEITKTMQNSSAAVLDSLNRIAMATLNRQPSEREEKVFRTRYRALTRSLPQQEAMQVATEDMLWAYLNSSEFASLQ